MDAVQKIDISHSFEMASDRMAHRGARSDFYFRPEPWIEDLVSQVERKLKDVARSDIHLLDVIGQYMLFGYAKRLRPLFVMLGQLMFREEVMESAVDCASAAELIHCASLFHDDVIDEAGTRKGRRAANAVWGNKSAVIMGDHFFVLAYTLLSATRDIRLIDIFVETCRALAEGITLEIKYTNEMEITEEVHLDIIKRKTATFFANTALTGGYLAGASDKDQKMLYSMGENFGLAFQLSDDLLDIYADPAATGKPRGMDLSGGMYTTAVIHGLKTDLKFSKEFVSMVSKGTLGEKHIDEIAGMLKSTGSLDHTWGLIKKYCDKAYECLDKLPEGRANSAFRGLVEIIRGREY
jgi:geranylgeranyl pyrophosphate synthase